MRTGFLKTPIIMLVFNRPDLTRTVFQRVSQVRPSTMLIVADGPRPHVEKDADLCQQTRQIFDEIDWPCTVMKEYADVNLGCKRRVSSGITWAFAQVEEAIILEDDCLPDLSFFEFCQELLEKYRWDTRVMAISGDNFQRGKNRRDNNSYYFSYNHHIWGWATWRRAWKHYDIDMTHWPEIRDSKRLQDLFGIKALARQWHKIFEASYRQEVQTWDHQWALTCLQQSGFCIMPKTNLVQNIGFSSSGTHTTESDNKLANLTASQIEFPLKHPDIVIQDAQADYNEIDLHSQGLFKRIGRKFYSFLNALSK